MSHPALIDDLFDEILAKLRTGATIAGALRGTALSQTMLSRRLDKYPEMRRRFDEARHEGGLTHQDSLRDKVRSIAFDDEHPKQWQALDRSLEAYVPEFKRRTVVEHTGPGLHWAGAAGEIVDAEYEELPDDELRAIAAGNAPE